MTFEALRDKHFPGREADLRQLCAKRVFFYNHFKRTVEFESEPMRRVAASWLQEERHLCRTQLLRQLRAWQEAKGQQAEAEHQAGFWQRHLAAFRFGMLGAARSRAEQLEREIKVLRGKLESQARASASSQRGPPDAHS